MNSRIFPAPSDVKSNPEIYGNNEAKSKAKSTIDSSDAGNSKRFSFLKVGPTGLLAHLLISRIDALTSFLENAETRWATNMPSARCSVTEFCECFGPRLQVSFWMRDQMDFHRWVVSKLGIDETRLTLLRSSTVTDRLLNGAIESGWVGNANNPNPPGVTIFTSEQGRQDSVFTGPHQARIEQRFSIQFVSDERLVLGSKIEFLFCSLVCWCWLQARPKVVSQ
jgi:hypothetical protein